MEAGMLKNSCAWVCILRFRLLCFVGTMDEALVFVTYGSEAAVKCSWLFCYVTWKNAKAALFYEELI